jgi:hypothetical protein
LECLASGLRGDAMAHSSVVRLTTDIARLPPGLTPKGWDLLARAKAALVREQSNFTMVEKVHLLWDLGDAWQDGGWFTDSEKTAAQLIIEESSDAGTDSFMPQVWRFEREKSLAVRRLGPAPDRARVLARLRGYKEPWQHELIEDDIIALEIDVLFDRRAARERKIAPIDTGNAAADLAYFDDPTARKLRALYQDYQVSQRAASWRARRDAASRFLDVLRRVGSAPPLMPCALALEDLAT